MISIDQLQDLLGRGGTIIGGDGYEIGHIGQIYMDDDTGQPEWVTVKTGLFGTAERFIPLAEGTIEADSIRVPYDKSTVKDSPRMNDDDEHLSVGQEEALFQYYGLGHSSPDSDPGLLAGEVGEQSSKAPSKDRHDESMVQAQDTSGPNTDAAMTRSEERLQVGTEKVQSGKARLRKYVVSETVTTTVPVSHEEVRIEREPITESNRDAALSGAELTEEEVEVTLHAERPVVEKETVPVERIRLNTDAVTEEQQVTEEIRKEQIDTDIDGTDENRHQR
ncbi:MAG: PRC and DUF2382 domain-containing protein [Specibacter sp.]